MYITFFWTVVLLLSNRENNRAKYFLGMFMTAAFFVYFSHAIFFQEEFLLYQLFDPVYIFSSLAVYPLYYWYIKLLTIEPEFRWHNLRLLAPAVLLSFASFVVYQLMTHEERMAYIIGYLFHRQSGLSDSVMIQIQKWIFIFSRVVFAFQVLFFFVNGRQLVLRYNQRVANFYSNLESRTILWVNFLLYSFVATSVMSMIFNFLGREIFLDSLILLIVPSFIFSVLLFFIGQLGYMQNHTVVDLERDESRIIPGDEKKFNNEQLRGKILELFAVEKVYRHSDLKITQVARLLGTNRSYVSALINHEFSSSFSEFVNGYRIIEAKELLEHDISQVHSLNYVSEKAGFGSVGTFIRVFKETEGITPGRYREHHVEHLS